MLNEKTRTPRDQISKLVEEYAAIALAPGPFLPGVTKVPPSGKLLDTAELKNMVEPLLDGWLTIGRFNRQFQKKLATFIGVKHLITVNSGSSAT
jgi:CDP-6-deoxy-D-xylo-4-hexulose-3-dehydrase